MHVTESTEALDCERLGLNRGLEALQPPPRHVSVGINSAPHQRWQQCNGMRGTHWMAIRVPSATRMKSYGHTESKLPIMCLVTGSPPGHGR